MGGPLIKVLLGKKFYLNLMEGMEAFVELAKELFPWNEYNHGAQGSQHLSGIIKDSLGAVEKFNGTTAKDGVVNALPSELLDVSFHLGATRDRYIPKHLGRKIDAGEAFTP